MAASDARLFPIRNTAFRYTFPIYDNTGALVPGAAGLDSEVSIDQGAFADCTNEATEIGSSGFYYIDLVAGEMNGYTVSLVVNTSTVDAKPAAAVFYPIDTTISQLSTNVVSMADNTLTASALATDAVTEIQSGLATASALTTVDTVVDAIQAKTDNLPADPAATSNIPTATENADELLKRDMGAVTGEASRSVLNAMRFIRNGFTISGVTLSVLEEDDTTVAYTRDLTTDPAAQPITGVS